jgi:hypothetical protein
MSFSNSKPAMQPLLCDNESADMHDVGLWVSAELTWDQGHSSTQEPAQQTDPDDEDSDVSLCQSSNVPSTMFQA